MSTETYAIYVQSIIATEQRRQSISATYLSLMGAGFAAIGAIRSIDPAFLVIPLTVVSLVWLSSLVYLGRLAKSKFHVIERMEQDWVIKPFGDEWHYFKASKTSFATRWISKLTFIEMIIPALALVTGTTYLAYRLILLLCWT